MRKNPLHYRIKNWDTFQQYKDRNPKWVKLHYETLSSADWVDADDQTRVLMIVCMLVGSRHGGQVPNDLAHLKRVGYLNFEPTFDKLLQLGFLIRPKYLRQKGIPVRNARPEKESEIETEEETESKKAVCAVAPKSTRKVRSSLPEIWPNDLDRQWALKHWREKGREDLCENVEGHMAEARDHHSAANTMSADWPASWRTWAQRVPRYNRKANDGRSKPRSTDSHLAGIASLIAEGRARRQQ